MNAPGDAVAWRQARDAGAVGLVAERGDRARALHADGHWRLLAVGMRAGVDAVAHVYVDEVDAGVIDLDQHFARAGCRGRNVVRTSTRLYSSHYFASRMPSSSFTLFFFFFSFFFFFFF